MKGAEFVFVSQLMKIVLCIFYLINNFTEGSD